MPLLGESTLTCSVGSEPICFASTSFPLLHVGSPWFGVLVVTLVSSLGLPLVHAFAHSIEFGTASALEVV